MTNSPTNLENAERAEMTMTPHAYAQEYEFRGDTDYTPSDFERTMIEDAILGYLGEARIAERAERGTFSPPFSYVPIPLDEEGQGPADDVDAVSVAHDVWDANCVTVATCGNEEAARSVAALMNAGVEARIRAERAEMEPKVKPLEWRVEGENRNGPWLWEASSIVKGYTIRHMPNDLYKLDGHGEWATLKAAKAAAQSDFASRIRSCLIDKPEAVEAASPQSTLRGAADAYVAEHGIEHSGGIVERAFEAGALWVLKADADEEMYEIGKRDGFEEAVQEIDQKTGGDGEYRVSMLIGGGVHDERHTPDAPAMIQRIVDRFEVLNLLDDATKDGRDQPDDAPADKATAGEVEPFDQIVAARKAHVDAVTAYNARLEFVRAERERGNWLTVDREYAAMAEAQRAFHRLTQELADAALTQEPTNE